MRLAVQNAPTISKGSREARLLDRRCAGKSCWVTAEEARGKYRYQPRVTPGEESSMQCKESLGKPTARGAASKSRPRGRDQEGRGGLELSP